MTVNPNYAQPSRDRTCPTCDQLRRQLKGLRARNLFLVQRAQRTEALVVQSREEVRELKRRIPIQPIEKPIKKPRPPSATAIAAMRATTARRIIATRKAVGLTQSALAKKAGIRVETLNRLEKRKHTSDPETMAKINKVLEKALARR